MEEKKFSQELKNILRDRQILQKDLAERLGVQPPTISNVINGRDRLGKKQAIEWGRVLGVDPLWLMTQGEQGNSPNGSPPITTEAALPAEIINVPILSPDAWREYIELGRAYVLELVDWRRLIKIVRKGSDTLHYLLESYNVGYDSDEVAKSFINSVWLVVASVNREEI